jgi:hypothetical protein
MRWFEAEGDGSRRWDLLHCTSLDGGQNRGLGGFEVGVGVVPAIGEDGVLDRPQLGFCGAAGEVAASKLEVSLVDEAIIRFRRRDRGGSLLSAFAAPQFTPI